MPFWQARLTIPGVSHSSCGFLKLQASEYLALLAERLQACEAELMKQEERLQQQIAETEKAMQERKVMDKLREKDYARYQYRQAQAEQRQTDEIARNVFLRQAA